ncbi:MAG: transposase domain-containing protein, partial [Gemmataceae bacterium]|nr:transposase domain-containing protein [Gemmataceae bacterium]
MARIYTELDQFSQWPACQRLAALRQLLPRELIDRVVAESACPSHFCRRLPNGFVLWFVVAIGLFHADSYRQVFRWLNPFRTHGTPGRSTL